VEERAQAIPGARRPNASRNGTDDSTTRLPAISACRLAALEVASASSQAGATPTNVLTAHETNGSK
jgi:hypothetical protein